MVACDAAAATSAAAAAFPPGHFEPSTDRRLTESFRPLPPQPQVGGLAEAVTSLGKALHKKGHLVEIILPNMTSQVGGLAEAVTGLGKALHKKGHLVEIILPKYECLQLDQINNFKVLDVIVQSYFEDNIFNIWTGTVEAVLELLHQSWKKIDIIHCHDWQTA